MDRFRSCSWSELTDANYIRNNILNTSTTSGYNIRGSTETVTLSTYPISTTPTQVVRTNGAASIVLTNGNLVNADIVRIDLALTWVANAGTRSRSESVSSIIAKNVP